MAIYPLVKVQPQKAVFHIAILHFELTVLQVKAYTNKAVRSLPNHFFLPQMERAWYPPDR